MGIYGSGLALRVIEEVRWYNEVSKDPELSRLVHEVREIGTPAKNVSARSSVSLGHAQTVNLNRRF